MYHKVRGVQGTELLTCTVFRNLFIHFYFENTILATAKQYIGGVHQKKAFVFLGRTLKTECGPVVWVSMRNHIETTPSHSSNDSLNWSQSSIFRFGSGQYSPFTPPVGLSGDLPNFPNYSSHVTHSVGIPTSERRSPGVVINRRQSFARRSPGVVINRQQFLNTKRSPGVVIRRTLDLDSDGNNIFNTVPSSTFNSPGINDFSIVREEAAIHSSDSELEIQRNVNRR